MKDNQKIYIRGNKERGDEIRNILTGLGAHALTDISCNNDRFIYFINHDNEISVALVGSEVAKIIMDNYRELHLPERCEPFEQWTDGSILYSEKDGLFLVFDGSVYLDDGVIRSTGYYFALVKMDLLLKGK